MSTKRQNNDRRLTEILTELYPDPDTALTVTRYVGLETDTLDFSGSAQTVWARIVQHAKQRNQTRLLLAYARQDAPTRDDLRQIAIEELGTSERDWALRDMGTQLLDALRDEMRAMEERLTKRIDAVDAKVDTLKAVSMIYTSKKKAAWMIGFVLFCLPCMLFLEELRLWLDVSLVSATAVIWVTWGLAAVLFLYGMGYLRDL